MPRAYQLIESAQVHNNLSTIVDKLPTTESQTRPLTRLEPEQQKEVLQKAVKTAPGGAVLQSITGSRSGGKAGHFLNGRHFLSHPTAPNIVATCEATHGFVSVPFRDRCRVLSEVDSSFFVGPFLDLGMSSTHKKNQEENGHDYDFHGSLLLLHSTGHCGKTVKKDSCEGPLFFIRISVVQIHNCHLIGFRQEYFL